MKTPLFRQCHEQIPHRIDKGKFAAYYGLYEGLSSRAAVGSFEILYREVLESRYFRPLS